MRSFSLEEQEGGPEFQEEDVADLLVTSQHRSQHNGVTHVYLRQRFEGLEIYGADTNVNLAADGSILSAHNGFIPGIRAEINRSEPVLTAAEAVQRAADYLQIELTAPLAVVEAKGGAAQEVIFEGGEVSLDPIPARLMFLPVGQDKTRLVWNSVLHLPDGSEWLDLNIDAETGEILSEANWVAHAGYRVIGLPLESPDDGARSLKTDPHHLVASPHGWHDTNGIAGPEHTDTRGNNVFAQEDEDADDAGGIRAEGGTGLNFDFSLDLNSPPQTYRDASLTNLFYWNNLLHDLHYQYGFDEPAGNFQHNNYSRGGVAGDAVQADSLDGSGTNNANFATPPDGMRPRMQMFLWTGVEGGVTVNTPASISGDLTATPAAFGPMLSANVTGNLVLANDGSTHPTRACFPLVNPGAVAGKIVLIDRGGCNFVDKVKHAQTAGAVGVIVANHVPDSNLIRMTGTDPTIVIPSFFITYEDGQRLRAVIGGGVSMTLRAQIDRDSSLDNLVIIHEYGHGVSNRLTGGAANASALSAPQSRGMGEGWSDWWGLVLTAKPEDSATTWRGVGNYLLGQDRNGAGIRPAPYTTDFSKNDLTYGDLVSGELSVPHGIGTVWCTALWEVYWNLVAAHGFDPDFYEGDGGNNVALQLIMDGLKLQPANPSFLDARDAILLADQINNGGANEELLWQAFAKRGMGYSAYDGGSASALDVVESFDLPDDLEVTPEARTPFLTHGPPGGPFAPPSRSYTLENTGTVPLEWTATSGVAWATVNPSSGTLAPGTSTLVDVTLSVAANALPKGTLEGRVTFRNLTSGIDQSRTLSISINELDGALDTNGVRFYTGLSPWFPQNAVTHDGVDAAQSGEVTHDQLSTMRTDVTGPDTLTFWWKVSSEENFDFLELRLDGEIEHAISGEVAWTQVTLEIPPGTHQLEWIYRKDYSLDAGLDAAWVDQVRLVALESPIITSRAEADGLVGKPFSYQITATASPTEFGSDPLPAGLVLDEETGLISGIPLGSGNDLVNVSATNSFGPGTKNIAIRIREIAPIPFSDGFESGGLSDYWLAGGTNRARNTVTQDHGPIEGDWHLTMDSSAIENSRNELSLAADLSAGSDLLLTFRAREFADESHGPPPTPFIRGADFDGVAISEDGISWYEVKPLRGAIRGAYTLFAVELDKELLRHGLEYNDAFRIRFNHFDNEPIPNDGFAFDDIRIQSVELESTIELTESPADGSPLFGGIGPAHAEITLTSSRDGVIGTTTSDGLGQWAISGSGLRDGNHLVTVAIFGIPVRTETFRVENNRPPSEITHELIPFESSWKYRDDGSDQYAAAPPFFAESYDDSGWSEGVGRFGYGDDGEATTINYGANPANKPLVTYFRKTFDYEPGTTAFERGVIHFYADDGVVVYLNGVELHRLRVSAGAVTHSKSASSEANGDHERYLQRFEFSPSLIRAGENLLAVSVHNRSASNDDLGFDLRLTLSRNWFFSGLYLNTSHNSFDKITTADINADGMPDVIHTRDTSPTDVLESRLNLGDNLLAPPVVIDSDLFDGEKPLVSDLDRNGTPDLVNYSFSGNIIKVAKNNAGAYTQSQSIINYYPFGISLGDLDGDDYPDLLYQAYQYGAGYTDRAYGWRRNNQSGVFGSFQEIGRGNAVSRTGGLIAADMDGDGDRDVVVCMFSVQQTGVPGTSTITWHENNGNGTFGTEHEAFQSGETPTMYAEDLDLDGDIDLVIDLLDATYWHENQGDGTFSRRWAIQIGGYLQNLRFRDLDNDGDPDLLCYFDPLNDRIEWRENDGKGNFSLAEILKIGAEQFLTPGDVDTTDWNGDGFLDILVRPHTKGLGLIMSKNGAGPRITRFDVNTNTVAAGEGVTLTWQTESAVEVRLNGEIVAANGSVNRTVGTENTEFLLVATNPDGTSESSLTVFVPDKVFDEGTTIHEGFFTKLRKVAIGDLTGDGLPEIVVADELTHRVAWLPNEGGGRFGSPVLFTDFLASPQEVEVADFNQDGVNDIVMMGEDEIVAYYRNLGGATFAPRTETVVPSSAYRMRVFDMDLNGAPDLLISDGVSIKIRLNNGNGTFGGAIDTTFSPVNDYQIADVTGDGIRDFIRLSNSFIIFPGTGPMTFSFPNRISLASGSITGAHSVHVADFSGSGKPLPFMGHALGARIYRDQGFGQWTTLTSIPRFESLDNGDSVVGDFDRDGDIDIAFSIFENFGPGAAYWIENDGKGVFSAPQVIARELPQARDLHLADMDGDGKPDLIRPGEKGNIALFRNVSGRALRPSLATDSDSGGFNSDNVTNNANPDFVGMATPGSTIVLRSSLDGILGSTSADGSGFWSITGQKLSHGQHLITISEDGGNSSDSLIVKIDAIAERPAELALTEESDTGASASDGLTRLDTPEIQGIGEQGSTIELFSSIDGAIGSGVANSEFWITTRTLSEGEHTITAVATDLAGNISEPSGPLLITVDTTPPAMIAAPLLESTSDTGVADDDGVTSDSTPTFTGTAEAGAPVVLFANGNPIGTQPGGGEWTITTTSLPDGLHEITARQTDPAGNLSPPSDPVELTIDTVPPATPSRPDLLESDDTGVSSADNLTSKGTPTFRGDSATGTTVLLRSNGVLVGSGPGGPAWQLSPSSNLGAGTSQDRVVRNLSVQVQDIAGNLSTASPQLSVIIDQKPPLPQITLAPGQLNPATRAPIAFNVNFGEPVAGFTVLDVTPTGTAAPGGASLSGGTTTYRVELTRIAGEGTVGIGIASGTATDEAGNGNLESPAPGGSLLVEVPSVQSDATPLPILSGTATFAGLLGPADRDFFQFHLSEGRHFTLRTLGGTHTIGALRNEAGEILNDPVSDGDAGGGGNFEIQEALGAGTYYVEIFGDDTNGEGAYELEFAQGDEAHSRPDVFVGPSLASATGRNLYGTPAGQTITLVSRRAQPVQGILGVENDGAIRDEFTLQGGGGNRFFGIAYYHDGANVSGTVQTARQMTGMLADGDAPHLLEVKIQPNKRLLKKTKRIKGRRSVTFKTARISLPVTSRSRTYLDIRDSGLIEILSTK